MLKAQGEGPRAHGQGQRACGQRPRINGQGPRGNCQGPMRNAQGLGPTGQGPMPKVQGPRVKAQSPRHHSQCTRPKAQEPMAIRQGPHGQGPRAKRTKGQWPMAKGHMPWGQGPMPDGQRPRANVHWPRASKGIFGKCCQHAHIHFLCIIEMGVITNDEGCCCFAVTSFSAKGQGPRPWGQGHGPTINGKFATNPWPRSKGQPSRAKGHGGIGPRANATGHNSPMATMATRA